MRKRQLILICGGTGVALALLGAILLVRSLPDEAQLKARVDAAWAQTTDRELGLDHLQLNLFPLPRLQADGVAIANPKWAHDSDFVTADSVTADIALLPLLHGKLEIKNVDLKGVQLNLEKNADGRYNWTSLYDQTDADKSRPRLSLQELSNTALRSLRIRDATVTFRAGDDRQQAWQIKDLALSAGRGLHDIRLKTRLLHAQHTLQIDGKLDDLSHLGSPEASTQGSLEFVMGKAQATIAGVFPLDRALTNADLQVKLDVDSLKSIHAFLDRPYQPSAALRGDMRLHADKRGMQLKDFTLQLGEMHASGHANVDRTAAKARFDVQLQADQVDMVQTALDAGRPPLPPKPADELFHDNPLPWRLLTALQGTEGKLALQIARLKLRSGITVSDAHAQTAFDGDRMTVTSFTGKLLQGKANGEAVFTGEKKSVDLTLHIADASLGEWLQQKAKHLKVKGGKMQVDAHLVTQGDSMKDLAAAISGPVDVRIGDAVIESSKAGNAEHLLTGLFSAKDASQVNMACAAGHLVFHSGVAKGDGIAGARSDVSQLLTSGNINMRSQTLDLHGRVRARSGVSLGLSNIADEVKIVGKLSQPTLTMDASGVLGAIARIGAAIMTGGVSLVATSIWDGANPQSDPCQIVFASARRKAQER